MENKNIIENLKKQIEERRDYLKELKSKNLNKDEIKFTKSAFKDLLNEFETTISHSLQVIKIFEVLNNDSFVNQSEKKEPLKSNGYLYNQSKSTFTPTKEYDKEQSQEIKLKSGEYLFETNFDKLEDQLTGRTSAIMPNNITENIENEIKKENFIYHKNKGIINRKPINNIVSTNNSSNITFSQNNQSTKNIITESYSNDYQDFSSLKLNYDYGSFDDYNHLVLNKNAEKNSNINIENFILKKQGDANHEFENLINEPQPENIKSNFNMNRSIESNDKSVHNSIDFTYEPKRGIRQKILKNKISNNNQDNYENKKFKTIESELNKSNHLKIEENSMIGNHISRDRGKIILKFRK